LLFQIDFKQKQVMKTKKIKKTIKVKGMMLTFHSPQLPNAQKKRATIVGIVEPKAKTRMNIGVAVCSLQDKFEKNKGRMIAEGRARKEKSRFVTLNVKDKDAKKVFYDFASKFSNIL